MRFRHQTIQSHRSRRFRSAPLAFLLAAAACVGVACGDGDARPRSTVVVGDGDRAENGVLSIDEAALRGTIEDGTLTVRVPVTSLVDKDTSGTLRLRLLSVDGKKEIEVADLPYSLSGEESATLTATVTTPEGITEQQDLVGFNVRVDDSTAQGLRVTRSLLYVVELYDLTVEGPGTLRQAREVSYRVRVLDALDKVPLEGREVTFEVLQEDEVVQTKVVTTEMTGDAQMRVKLDKPGDYKVRARMSSQGTSAQLEDPIVVDGATGKLLLTTDKPIYQPGQLINLRALSLSHDGNKPQAGAEATFEIEDAKGNKIYKKAVETDEYGIAFSTFRLGSILNEGTFKIRVVAGGVTSEKTVNVSPYALPKFDVAVQTEDPWYAPGSTINGTIDSRYFFGKPVTGQVLVEGYSIDVGQTLFQTVMGSLSADGHYEFSLMLPNSLPGLPLGQGSAAIELRVTVTDSAGQKVEKSRLVTVSAQGAAVSLVPESGRLVPGIENELLLFATDPLGSPLANAAVQLTAPDSTRLNATTDEFGQALLAWTPERASSAQGAAPQTFAAVVTLDGGKEIAATFDFSSQAGADHLILRTDKSVYEVGETVKVDITSTEEAGTVYVDWLNDGQTVDMRTLTADAGKATFSTAIDTALSGSNRIEAYLVDSDGQIVRTGRTIFARSDAALNIEVTTDEDLYAPGTPAKLTLSVTDETGAPAVAALGLQIVDQAVFALVDAKPGLLRTYFEIEDRLAQPQYEIHPPHVDFSNALFRETADKDEATARAAQQRTGAALAAMKNTSLTGIQHGSLPAVLQAAKANLAPTFSTLKTDLTPQLKTVVTQASAALKLRGCEMYNVCGNVDYFTALGEEIAGRIDAFDFWGNAFEVTSEYQVTLVSAGPDERSATSDDETLTFDLYELGLSSGTDDAEQGPGGLPNAGGPFPGNAAGGTGNLGLGGGAGASAMNPDGSGAAASGPRVRRDFPETLYVNPSLITGPDGTATIEVGMADSITEWRVSALANSSDGRLGGSESGIKVFQDFFVDVAFPATLTRGDEVSFPIAVYNYLDVAQTVTLELQPGAWYTALGPTTTSVQLDPGQVTGVSFPVQVNDVGLRTLTVVATGSAKADAVARTVRVVPDGKVFPAAFSGSLNTQAVTHSVSFPASAVPGSGQLYLDVFPAFLAQAVQGMDSILAEPNGCFEQTTSSAWPNVLVTEYMKETDQITPEIQMKAEALMSTGYQRLLTFEHTGGGFSWFGEQDPAPFLSVTAFGIMEFSDMARVHEIDPAMLARTVQWIVSQQKADGSFAGDMSEFFSFHTSTVRNTAFTAWALASAGDTSADAAVQAALAYVKANLGSDNDAYTLGIVANAFALGASNDPALTDVLALLDDLQKVEGDGVYWDSGDTQTNFYGGGNDAAVASTALVAHAMLIAGVYPATVEKALHYLTSKKDPSGNFGSTQATIWALRTLLLSAKKGTTGAVGSMTVSVDGVEQQTVTLREAQADVMTRVDLSVLATTGDHDVKVDFIGTGKPSFNLVSSHHLPWALVPAEPTGPLSIDVAYDKTDLFVDDSVKATVTLSNNEAVTQNMVLVTLGIAPGFSVDTDDLKPYLDSGAISKFEMTGRQLILYITALAPSSTQTFSYDLTATMPVTAVDGGAEARMYYEPEKKTRSPARQLKAAAK